MVSVKHLKVQTKIISLTLISALFMIVIGFAGYKTTDLMSTESNEMYNQNVRAISDVSQIIIDNRTIEAALLEFIITTDDERNTALDASIKERLTQNQTLYTDMSTIKLSPATTKLYDTYTQSLTDYTSKIEEVLQNASQNNNTEAYRVFQNDVEPLRIAMNDTTRQLNALLKSEAQINNQEAVHLASVAKLVLIIVFIAGALLSVLLGLWISRTISRPLKHLQELMSRAGEGDLTVEGTYTSRDEIGQVTQSFNAMVNNVKDIIRKVDESAMTLSASSEELTASADQTAQAAEHIAVATNEMSTGIESQVESVNQVNQSIGSMYERMGHVAAISNEVNQMTEQMNNDAKNGLSEVTEITNLIQEIAKDMQDNLVVMTNLNDKSNQISIASSAIQQIAQQTNLLALNASIEAARAGDAGRGFAVVAEEIRKLASSTADSSKLISNMVQSIQHDSNMAVEQVHKSSDSIQSTVASSTRVNTAFQAIQHSVSNTTEKILRTGSLIQEVAKQSETIAEAMGHVSAISEESSAGIQQTGAASEEQLSTMEEVSSAARYLADLAENLQTTLARFKI
ncbi:methyl-accepting chemotaxis protein [Paenibacillus sp. CFBP13512]|nr:methyl-accepting chemotaxis protein [Paenibacillus sp. CFBP13512]